MGRLLLIGSLLASLFSALVHAETQTRFPAPGPEAASLSIHAATDLVAVRPLILDFQTTASDITVVYNEYQTNDLFELAATACRSQENEKKSICSSRLLLTSL